MSKPRKIYVAGHHGMVGAAIVRALRRREPGATIVARTHAELDLRSQGAVESFLEAERPDQVYLAAAKVGGIHANSTYPAEFLYDNLMITANVIHAAHRVEVSRLLFLGSSCIYPRLAPQPIPEDALLTGPLEPTNEPYAIAKIAGIKLCESYHRQYGRDFRSVMPTNLYGPGDNYHPQNSHVIPALLRRFHEAKLDGAPRVVIWGSGTPLREFLHVDDLAAACLFVMELDADVYRGDEARTHLNVGSGREVTILDLARTIAAVVGFTGSIDLDRTQPDGTPRKLIDSGALHRLGWQAAIDLEAGLASTYEDALGTPRGLRLG